MKSISTGASLTHGHDRGNVPILTAAYECHWRAVA